MAHELPNFFLIIDLEATCDNRCEEEREVTRALSEIIEFPWVLYDTRARLPVVVEQTFVLPEETRVTKFCQEMVGIPQAKLEREGVPLARALQKLSDFLSSLEEQPVVLTDGKWDMQFMMRKECTRKKLEMPPVLRSYVDLQSVFASFHPEARVHPKPNLRQMVKYVKTQIEGSHHCGVDDCLSIANVVTRLLEQGCAKWERFEVPGPEYDPMRDAQFVDFNSQFPEDVGAQQIVAALQFEEPQVACVWLAPHIPAADNLRVFVVCLAPGFTYECQTFFRRSNVRAEVYSWDHFHYRLRECDPMLLALLYAEPMLSRLPEPLDPRSFLRMPSLLEQTRRQLDQHQRQASRFQRNNVHAQAQLHLESMSFTLSVAEALINTDLESVEPLELPPRISYFDPAQHMPRLEAMVFARQQRASGPLQAACLLGQHLHVGAELQVLGEALIARDSGKVLFSMPPEPQMSLLSTLPKQEYPLRVKTHYDGMDVFLMHWRGEWRLFTRETSDASELVRNRPVYPHKHRNCPALPSEGTTFAVRTICDAIWEERGYQYPTHVREGTVYRFSLVLPPSFGHQGLVIHQSADLIYVGSQEEAPQEWRRPEECDVASFPELRSLVWRAGSQSAGVVLPSGELVPALGWTALREVLTNWGQFGLRVPLLQVAKFGDVDRISQRWPALSQLLHEHSDFFASMGARLTREFAEKKKNKATWKLVRSMRQRDISDGETFLRSLGHKQLQSIWDDLKD